MAVQYEIKHIAYTTNPEEQPDGSLHIPIRIDTGIVGDPYGFLKQNDQIVIVSMSDSGWDIKSAVIAFAVNFVQTNYPDVV